MLTFFRKHATNWMIKVALFLIVIVFIFWGGYSYQSQKARRLARVGGEFITYGDYNEAYNQLVNLYRNQFGDAFSEETIKALNLEQRALDMLIQRHVLLDVAKEMGLSATVQEVQQEILSNPAFQTDGAFDQRRYNLLLRQNRLSPEVFEAQTAQGVSTRKIESFIKRQAVVTEDEILAQLQFNHSPIQVAYVQLSPQDFSDQVEPTEEALRSYYEKNKDRYKTQEKRRFDYVLFRPNPSDFQVTDQEVRNYYEAHRDEFHEEKEVKARHILFRLPRDASEEKAAGVRAKAEKVLEEAKQGADFVELVKEHSEEPGAAERGGDLGFFTRDRMVTAFSDAAFSMEVGEVSDLVRTPFGLHIIKVEDIRPERTVPFQEAKAQIEAQLLERLAREAAQESAREFADVAFAEKDLKQAAEFQKVDVETTEDWLAQQDTVKNWGADAEAMGKLFNLPEGEISDVLEFPEGFVVAQPKAVKPPEAQPFEEVKERVQGDFTRDKTHELAKARAEELLAEARTAGDLAAAVAEDPSLALKTSEWFTRREPDAKLPLRGVQLNALFRLTESRPFPENPVSAGSTHLVFQLLDRKAPDEETIEEKRASVAERIYRQKQNQLWQSWLDEQVRKADVEILQEL